MAVMIVSVLVVTVIFVIGTFIWWAMMNDWIKKDRERRGRHYGERGSPDRRAPGAKDAPRVIASPATRKDPPEA
jgi:hypothetical protein